MCTKISAIIILIMFSNLYSQETLSISVRGISDNIRNGAQRDRLEAILDAKRQACEKAGIKIESHTIVHNFQMIMDNIESHSKAILLPGYQIIEIGYTEDGTYNVVLVGKIKTIRDTNYSQLIILIALEEKLFLKYTNISISHYLEIFSWKLDSCGVKSITINNNPFYFNENNLVEISESNNVIKLDGNEIYREIFGEKVRGNFSTTKLFSYKFKIPAGLFKWYEYGFNIDNIIDNIDRIDPTKIREQKNVKFLNFYHDSTYVMIQRPIATDSGNKVITFIEEISKPIVFEGPFSLPEPFGIYPNDFKIIYKKN